MKPVARPVPIALVLGSILALLVFSFQNCGGNLRPKDGLLGGSLASSGDGASPNDHDHVHESLTIPLPSTTQAESIAVGDLITLPAGKALNLVISGRALMVRGKDGTTQVQMQVFGLSPNQHYGAHIHTLSCADGAGGHYKIDTSIADTLATNEIWPSVTTDANAYGYGAALVHHVARAEAVSVVIHGGPDNSKIACADLRTDQTSGLFSSGAFASLPGAPAEATLIKGRGVIASRINGQTEVRFAVSGLTPGAMYMAHVHTLACSEGAGGHYKIDPNITDTQATNEIWPQVTTTPTGQGFGFIVVDHAVRIDAKSLVIHGPTGTKLACADLRSDLSNLLLLEKGLERLPNLTGRVSLLRNLDGTTSFDFVIENANPSTNYTAHVHNRPCSVSGGAHYKVDETVTTALEANEVWLRAGTDATGRAHVTLKVPHTARPDAIAVVLHDPADAAKLACADLY